MLVSSQIREKVEQKVLQSILLAGKHFKQNYIVPTIHYDVRGTTGGYYRRGEVHFNPTLLVENVNDYLARTVPHEIAHYIDEQNGGLQRSDSSMVAWAMQRSAGGRVKRPKRDIHGASWQHICRILGMTDITRCHQYDTSNAQVKVKNKFEYKCEGCNKRIFMSSVRHNKMRSGRAIYWCSACGTVKGKLTYVAALGQRTRAEIQVLRQGGSLPKAPVVAPAEPKVAGATNIERAREVYKMYGALGRQMFIRKAVECGIKGTTASTYFAAFRSGK